MVALGFFLSLAADGVYGLEVGFAAYALTQLAILRWFRQRVILGDDEMVIVGYFRSKVIARDRIEGVGSEPDFTFRFGGWEVVALDLADAGTFKVRTLMGVNGFRSDRNRRVQRQISIIANWVGVEVEPERL